MKINYFLEANKTIYCESESEIKFKIKLNKKM